MGCVRQGLLESCGHAIGGDHVEAHAGADYDSSSLCFYVAAVRRQKDVDLAGDIEIVSLILEACVNHRRTSGREWAGTIRYDRNIRERRYC